MHKPKVNTEPSPPAALSPRNLPPPASPTVCGLSQHFGSCVCVCVWEGWQLWQAARRMITKHRAGAGGVGGESYQLFCYFSIALNY